MFEMPRLPLSGYQLFHSKDVDEVRERVARIFCPHGLTMVGRDAELDACHHSVLLASDISMNYVQYGAGVNIDPGFLGDFYLLQIPLRGSANIRCGGQRVDASSRMATLPSPTEKLSMSWAPDSPHLIVRFSQAILLRQLERLIQSPMHQPLVFDLGVPLESPALAPMLNFVKYLCTTLEEKAGLGGHQIAAHAESYLVSTLLQAARHNYSDVLNEGHRRSLLPRSVRRAQDFLHSQMHEPVSLADLCHHLGVSPRSLQQAFKEHLGEGPMTYLRNIRLNGVREVLKREGHASKISVTCVAGDHGFVHMGHFCSAYQSRFGELPSETLRKSRGVMQVPLSGE